MTGIHLFLGERLYLMVFVSLCSWKLGCLPKMRECDPVEDLKKVVNIRSQVKADWRADKLHPLQGNPAGADEGGSRVSITELPHSGFESCGSNVK